MKVCCLPITCTLALLLGGCAIGSAAKKTAQVWMDPSIPVGALPDRPSQVSLSLHATDSVNPNADSVAADVPVDTSGKGKFAVNLTGDNEADLADQLRVALKILQSELAGTPVQWTAIQTEVTAPVDVVDQQTALGKAPFTVTSSATPFPWYPVQTKSTVPFSFLKDPPDNVHPLLVKSGSVSNGGIGQALGQYAKAQGDAPIDAPVQPEKVATPITFKILQLKDDSVLLNADYAALSKDLKKALGSTYLADDDYVLKPGQFKFVNFQPLKDGVNYVAVIASYHDIDNTQWKKVFRVEPRGHSYSLLFTLNDTSVDIQGEN